MKYENSYLSEKPEKKPIQKNQKLQEYKDDIIANIPAAIGNPDFFIGTVDSSLLIFESLSLELVSED